MCLGFGCGRAILPKLMFALQVLLKFSLFDVLSVCHPVTKFAVM